MSNPFDGYVQAYGTKEGLIKLTESLNSYFEVVPYEECVEFSDNYYSFYSVQMNAGILTSLFSYLSNKLDLVIEVYAENPKIIEKGLFLRGNVINSSIEKNLNPYQDVEGMDLDIMEKYYKGEDVNE